MIEKQIESNRIYDGKVVKLRKDKIINDKGQEAYREIVDHNGGAGILVVSNNKILIEKQFRYAYNEVIYEIPAGKRENNDDFKLTAIRELEEETGLIALNIEEWFELYPTPGYTNERLRIYYVDKFSEGKTKFDFDEDITYEWIDAEVLYQMIKDGKIKDAKTVTAIITYLLKKQLKEI